MDFDNGALGVVHASRWATGHLNELRLRVYGDKGGIEVQHRLDGSQLQCCLGEDIESGHLGRDRCRIGADQLPALRRRGARPAYTPEPTFRHAAELQKVLDLAVVSDEKRGELKAQADTQ